MIKIYALYNPITNLPFYVGATKRDLNLRLVGHISDASAVNRSVGIMQRRAIVINTLIKIGLRPEIRLLKEVLPTETDYYEIFFHQLFIAQGIELHQSKHRFFYQKTIIAPLLQ